MQWSTKILVHMWCLPHSLIYISFNQQCFMIRLIFTVKKNLPPRIDLIANFKFFHCYCLRQRFQPVTFCWWFHSFPCASNIVFGMKEANINPFFIHTWNCPFRCTSEAWLCRLTLKIFFKVVSIVGSYKHLHW